MKPGYILAALAGVVTILLAVMTAGLNVAADDMQREYSSHCFWPLGYLGPCQDLQTKIAAVRGIVSNLEILFVITLLLVFVCGVEGSRSAKRGARFCPTCGSRGTKIGEFCQADGTKLKEAAR